MSGIEARDAGYNESIEDYALINAMCSGERLVKQIDGVIVNPYGTDSEGMERYKKYLSLAMLYSITETTVEQLHGMAFSGEHKLEGGENISSVIENIDGNGNGVLDLYKRTVQEVIKYGRDILLVDYPDTGGAVTVAQKSTLGLQAKIVRFSAEQVFNVRAEKGKVQEVRILDSYQELMEGGINYETKPQVLRLRLVDGVYSKSIWRDGKMHGTEGAVKDHNNNAFDYIPIYFVGSENNDYMYDKPPMRRLAEIDRKIMQNSADSEINAHMTSGATLVVGLDKSFDEETFQKVNGKVNIGVFSSLNVGENGHAKFEQASKSDASRELVNDKIALARQIGAKLIVNDAVQNTKQGAETNAMANTSVLASIVTNCAKAYTSAFKDVYRFENGGNSDVVLVPYLEFSKQTIDAAAAAIYPELVESRIATVEESRIKLREAGILPSEINGEPVNDEEAILKMGEAAPVDTINE